MDEKKRYDKFYEKETLEELKFSLNCLHNSRRYSKKIEWGKKSLQCATKLYEHLLKRYKK